jgi:uncharacterized protein (DUF1330 family)
MIRCDTKTTKPWCRLLSKPSAGNFLVRGGKVENLEGVWSPKRFVIVEFSSVERAKAWWDSSEYAEAKALRQATANTQMIVVEGVS